MEAINEQRELEKFTESFCKNLGALAVWNGKKLVVTNVPPTLEKLFDKPGPYALVFAKEDEDSTTDLVTKGSVFLKSMMEYLDKRGTTALIKLKPLTEQLDVFNQLISIKNAAVTHHTKKVTYDSFLRFTFLTTYQYKNEKEQITSTVYVKDTQIVNPILDKFELTQGKSDELVQKSIENEYRAAKEYIRQSQQEKKNVIVQQLQEQLLKEIERVKAHYATQTAEMQSEYGRYDNQVKEIEKEYELKKITKQELDQKIKRAREAQSKLLVSQKKEQLAKEEQFFITDEINKHQLAVASKLMNTAILYYPQYTLELFIKNKDGGRILYWSINPLTNLSSSIQCDDCKKDSKEIALCAAGHLVCMQCGEHCQQCRTVICASCAQRKCTQCYKSACKNCLSKCSYCNTPSCKSHLLTNKLTQRLGCSKCLKICRKCNTIVETSSLQNKNSISDLCRNCRQKEHLQQAFERN